MKLSFIQPNQLYQSLKAAVIKGDILAVQACLKRGADPKQVQHTKSIDLEDESESIMNQIFINNHQDKDIIRLLIQHGADVNFVKSKKNILGNIETIPVLKEAIQYSYFQNDQELFELFISNGADPNYTDVHTPKDDNDYQEQKSIIHVFSSIKESQNQFKLLFDYNTDANKVYLYSGQGKILKQNVLYIIIDEAFSGLTFSYKHLYRNPREMELRSKWRNMLDVINLLLDQNVDADFENTETDQDGKVKMCENALEKAVRLSIWDVVQLLLRNQQRIDSSGHLDYFLSNKSEEIIKGVTQNLFYNFESDKWKCLSRESRISLYALKLVALRKGFSMSDQFTRLVRYFY